MTLSKHQAMVREFQTTFKQPVDLDHQTYRKERKALRFALLREEKTELLDALVDIAYIALGSIVECDNEARWAVKTYETVRKLAREAFGSYKVFDVAFERVHASNMDKMQDGEPLVNGVTVPYDKSKPYGKVLKRQGWVAHVLDDLV